MERQDDNSQVGVFAAVARDGVAALVEGEWYVPEEWFAEPERCRDAGIPEDIEFRTKGEMALSMIHRLRCPNANRPRAGRPAACRRTPLR